MTKADCANALLKEGHRGAALNPDSGIDTWFRNTFGDGLGLTCTGGIAALVFA